MGLKSKLFSVLKGLRRGQQGNAMVYVLILIALFAALSFVMARQTDTSEVGGLEGERAKVHAGNIIQVSNQMKQAVDTMSYTGTLVDDLDFILPGEAGYDTAPNFNKVFHPDGGGLVMPTLLPNTIDEVSNDPPAGWYMGRFNNVEWTPTTGQDAILVAYQLSETICMQINELLTGSTSIPVLSGVDLRDVFIDTLKHGGGANADFTIAECAACEGMAALCVEDKDNDSWAYYNIVAQQ